MNQSAKRVRQSILTFLVLLAFLRPDYFDQNVAIGIVINAIRICTFIVLAAYYVIRGKMPKLFAYVVAYVCVPFIKTILVGGNTTSAFRLAVIALGTIMLFDYTGRKNPTNTLDILNFLLELLIYANFMTIIFVPGGLYHYSTVTGWSSDKVWLFGLRNNHAEYLMLGCFCSGLKYYYSKKHLLDRFRVVLMHVITALTVFELDSGGGYVMLTAYFAMLITIKLFKRIRIDFSVAIVFHVVLFFLITVFSATMLFSDFFALFGKNGTATGRISLWATMWSHIIQKPILGHGYMDDADLLWLKFVAAGATTGHNAMIDMMFRGGIITFISFIVLLLKIRTNLKGLLHNTFIYNYTVISFVSIFLTMQSESGMDSATLFATLGLISILPNINAVEGKKNATVKFYSEPPICFV